MSAADRPLIYVAGPYTEPDPATNVAQACLAGDAIWDAGGCPFIPHLNIAWDRVSPQPYEVWLERDLGVLARCDGLLRLPGHSPGADAEVAWFEANARKGTMWVECRTDARVAVMAGALVRVLRDTVLP